MEQQQFKVALPLSTKLLFSVVLLLLVAIGFLTLSSILLLTDDKRAYTYQSQSTEAVLMGRDFVNSSKHAIDTLRLSLSAVEPGKPVSPQQAEVLQSLLNNQSTIQSFLIGTINKDSGAFTSKYQVYQQNIEQIGLKKEDFAIKEKPLTERKSEIYDKPQTEKLSFTFFNFSQSPQNPIMGVLLADIQNKSVAEIPVSIGFISLKDLKSGLRSADLMVATREGTVLFATDSVNYNRHLNGSDDPLYEASYSSSVSNGTLEYNSPLGKMLGTYFRPGGLDLIVLSRVSWIRAMSATYMLTEKFIVLGGMAIGAAIIFAILFSKSITAPINRLYSATREVAAGNFEVDLERSSRDEIGALTESFVAMSRKISDLIQESMKRVHLENELAIASAVQQNLIPPEKYENRNILLCSHYRSATECGGDWWGFFPVGNDRMAVMIADATGHGLPSALITAAARSCFSVLGKLCQEVPNFPMTPAQLLSYANRSIFEASSGQIMMTFFTGVFDFSQKTFTYASAGHNPPWFFKKEGSSYTLKSLVAKGQRLGEALNAAPFEEKSMSFSKDDMLFMYTDGLTEGKNTAGDMYSKKRARSTVEAQVPQGPETLIRELMADFMSHNGDKALDDDVTLVAAKLS